MLELTLEGAIPSKKNQRINRSDGKSFPSLEYSNWQKSAMIQVRQQTRQRFITPVEIEIICIFGRKVICDLDNRLSSILDMLKDTLVIKDDNWQCVPKVSVEAEYKKGVQNGAIIRIYEVKPIV